MNRDAIKISAVLDVAAAPAGEGRAEKRACTAPVSIARPAGKTITCVEGCLWLTEAGDPVDHILSAGQSRVLSGRGSAVLSPLPRGSYLIA